MDKGKEEDTLPPETLQIVNIISRGSEISGLTVSTTLSHICSINSVASEYEALDLEYEHLLTFFSHKVRRLRGPHDDALLISLNMENVLL